MRFFRKHFTEKIGDDFVSHRLEYNTGKSVFPQNIRVFYVIIYSDLSILLFDQNQRTTKLAWVYFIVSHQKQYQIRQCVVIKTRAFAGTRKRFSTIPVDSRLFSDSVRLKHKRQAVRILNEFFHTHRGSVLPSSIRSSSKLFFEKSLEVKKKNIVNANKI